MAQWFVTNCTAQEIKWIVRLVLKKLQIGCSDSTILKHFHVDAEALYAILFFQCTFVTLFAGSTAA